MQIHLRALALLVLLAVANGQASVVARGRQPPHAAWDHTDYIARRMLLGRVIHQQPCERLHAVLGTGELGFFLNGTDLSPSVRQSKSLRWHICCHCAKQKGLLEMKIYQEDKESHNSTPLPRVFVFSLDTADLVNATGCGGSVYDPVQCDANAPPLRPLDREEVTRLTEHANARSLQLGGRGRFLDLAEHVKDVEDKCKSKIYAHDPVCRYAVMRLLRLADAVEIHGGVAPPEAYRPKTEL